MGDLDRSIMALAREFDGERRQYQAALSEKDRALHTMAVKFQRLEEELEVAHSQIDDLLLHPSKRRGSATSSVSWQDLAQGGAGLRQQGSASDGLGSPGFVRQQRQPSGETEVSSTSSWRHPASHQGDLRRRFDEPSSPASPSRDHIQALSLSARKILALEESLSAFQHSAKDVVQILAGALRGGSVLPVSDEELVALRTAVENHQHHQAQLGWRSPPGAPAGGSAAGVLSRTATGGARISQPAADALLAVRVADRMSKALQDLDGELQLALRDVPAPVRSKIQEAGALEERLQQHHEQAVGAREEIGRLVSALEDTCSHFDDELALLQPLEHGSMLATAATFQPPPGAEQIWEHQEQPSRPASYPRDRSGAAMHHRQVSPGAHTEGRHRPQLNGGGKANALFGQGAFSPVSRGFAGQIRSPGALLFHTTNG
mmetsp:Transcript_31166/g.90584  ORF Transcript_31166/g.90584 Transcript_31166/m.90584 type:complete len:432 (-) Transcript_31166:399-1694(-)